ncbi:hypothetical protein BV25DRAFT_1778540, partial [Artomyces pyxidatus]
PAWLQDAVDHLKKFDLGQDWEECIDAYIRVERALEFPTGGSKLSAKDRPEFVHDWIKYARPWTGDFWAGTPNLNTFPNQWWAWWANLQPPTRARDAAGVLSRNTTELDWDLLRRGGKNGVLSVMVALAWW